MKAYQCMNCGEPCKEGMEVFLKCGRVVVKMANAVSEMLEEYDTSHLDVIAIAASVLTTAVREGMPTDGELARISKIVDKLADFFVQENITNAEAWEAMAALIGCSSLRLMTTCNMELRGCPKEAE